MWNEKTFIKSCMLAHGNSWPGQDQCPKEWSKYSTCIDSCKIDEYKVVTQQLEQCLAISTDDNQLVTCLNNRPPSIVQLCMKKCEQRIHRYSPFIQDE